MKFVKIGAGWDSQYGISYRIGDTNIYVFKNNRKAKVKSPDYEIKVKTEHLDKFLYDVQTQVKKAKDYLEALENNPTNNNIDDGIPF